MCIVHTLPDTHHTQNVMGNAANWVADISLNTANL